MSTSNEKKSIVKTIKHILDRKDIDLVAQKYTNDMLARVLNYQVEDYTKTRTGYSRSYKRLIVTLQTSESNNPETISFFLKVIPYDFEISRDFFIDDGIFLKESNFYEQAIPSLSENFNSEKWYPTCYLTKEDVIVLEDLECKGYKVIRNELMDNKAVLKSVLGSLARFHGSSIIMEHRLNHDGRHPMKLNEHYPHLFNESMFVNTKFMKLFLNSCLKVSCALANSFGYDSKLIEKAYHKAHDMVKPSKTHFNVICHGNLWAGNCMLTNINSSDVKSILVDFQHIRYAPLVTDILHFLHVNTSRSFRKNYERDMIEFYQSILRKTIDDNDTTANVIIPTIEEIFAAMDDLRLYGLVISAIYYSFILISREDIIEYTKDSESYEKFWFDNRVDLTFAQMRKNHSFKIRHKECIEELVEKSRLLF